MRCFVAVEVSGEIKAQLACIQARHRDLDRAVRWVDPAQIHLTLKFLGEVPEADLPAVLQVLNEVARRSAPFEFGVRGTGCFPPGGAARVLWVGIEESSGALGRLREACESAFAELGFAREGREFRPHLTLGRIREARRSAEIRAAARAESAFYAGTQRADSIVLFQSILSGAGARYQALGRALLGGSQ